MGRESNKDLILRYENIMISTFMVPILLFFSISSFITRIFILNESILRVGFDSLFLIGFAILFEIFLKFSIREEIKENLIILAVLAVLCYLVLRFYYLIGPTVWTLSIVVVMFSVLKINKKMLVLISVMIFALGFHTWHINYYFIMNPIYYISQNIAFLILFVVIRLVHGIIIKRFDTIKNQYMSIFKSEEKLSLTLTSVGDGVITIDKNGLIDFVNPVGERLTEWNNKEAFGKPLDEVFNIIDEETSEKIFTPTNEFFRISKISEISSNSKVLISKKGKSVPVEDTSSPIKDDNGNILGAVIVFRDCTERKARIKEIEYLSYHDQLTGLYNRRFFEEELKRLNTRRNFPLSIVFADINGLKTINDAFGHEEGDNLIKVVSKVMKKECREDDIISRTGGDEFIILLPKTELSDVEKLVERISAKIQEEKIMNIKISVSFGWDAKIEEGESVWNILKNAEKLMYKKKIIDRSREKSYVIKSILGTLYDRSPIENDHSKRVSDICKKIGIALNMSDDDIYELEIAGELHDIGKISVNKVILNKPDKLDDYEWNQIKNHPEIGYRLLGTSSEYYKVADYILSHHEKFDGTGYPKGIVGESINIKARIICLADAYDAMTSDRPYKKALDLEKAI